VETQAQDSGVPFEPAPANISRHETTKNGAHPSLPFTETPWTATETGHSEYGVGMLIIISFLTQMIFAYTAQQQITQSHRHGGESMSIDATQRQRFGMQAIVPTLALLILLFAGCTEKEATAPEEAAPDQASSAQIVEPEAPPTAEAPEPAVEPGEPQAATDSPADTQTASVDGQKIYQGSCQACHAAGVAGAPKMGDKDAWAPRIAKGNDALLSSVKNGLNAMPPKGGCMNCTEEELQAAIAFLVKQGS
jgi:cytochrome c5